LLDPLGSGGMGRVWKARDEVLRRDVAIKEVNLPQELSRPEREELRIRTLREARTAARLSHPNVVQIYDVLGVEDRPWIVMEYIRSRSLQQILTDDGPVSPRRAARIGLAVLRALVAAHRAGVLHRDVKPGNVLIADDGRVVLTDFGLATFDGGESSVTRPGLVWGSPEYVAPERAKHGLSSVETDLWSLGATLFAAVEGSSPYARPSAMATLTALAVEKPPTPQQAGPLKPVLTGLLRKDPRARMRPQELEKVLRRVADLEGRGRLRRLPRQRPASADPADRPEGTTGRTPAVAIATDPVAPAGGGRADPSLPDGSSPARSASAESPSAESSSPAAGSSHAGSPSAAARAEAVPGYSLPEAPTGVIGPVPPEAQFSPSRRAWLVTIAGLLVTALLMAGTVYLTNAQRQTGGTGTAAPASPLPSASPTPGPTVSSSEPLPGENGLPGGWTYHREPGRFRVAVPLGWIIERDGRIVRFREPNALTRLSVEMWQAEPEGALADTRDLDRTWAAGGSGAPPGYRRLRLDPVVIGDGGAEWEYTFSDERSGTTMQVLSRRFNTGASCFAISWTGPVYDSASRRSYFDLALAGFSTQAA
jgi:serine/threonine protein kinase